MSQGLTQMLQTMDGTNIEMRIAYQCAPLLAGLKPSNLLMLREREVTYVQWMLKQAGISYFIVAQEKGKAAVLLYNKGELQRYLAGTGGRQFEKNGISGTVTGKGSVCVSQAL